MHMWLSQGFVPSLFEKIDGKFDCIEDSPYWKCSPAYWTHLAKCFPGPARGGHIRPTKRCANSFLWRELEAIEPKLVIGLGGAVWDFFRRDVQDMTDRRLTDLVTSMVSSPREILVRRGKVQFEIVVLPHPGRSARAYWHGKGMKVIEERAIALCRDKVEEVAGN